MCSCAGRGTEHPVSNNLLQSTTFLTLLEGDLVTAKSRSRATFLERGMQTVVKQHRISLNPSTLDKITKILQSKVKLGQIKNNNRK